MRIEKIAEILTVAEKPALRTYIRIKCSLSSEGFNKYVELLLESGLLNAIPIIKPKHLAGRPTKRRMIYQTSVKGKLFLKQYTELTTLLNSDKKTPLFLL